MLWPEYLAFRAARDVITWRYLFSQALSHWLAYNFYSAEKTDAPGAEWFFGILAADPTIYLTVAMVFTTVSSSDMASSPLGRLRCKQKKDCACWPLWWIITRDGTPPGPWIWYRGSSWRCRTWWYISCQTAYPVHFRSLGHLLFLRDVGRSWPSG